MLIAGTSALTLALSGCGATARSTSSFVVGDLSDPAIHTEPSTVAATSSPSSSAAAAIAMPRGRAPRPHELALLRSLMRLAERVRGLAFVRRVSTRVQTRDEITAFARERVSEEAIGEARTLYIALGLLPRDLDVSATLVDVLGEQVVGFYDARSETLVVRDDVLAELDGQSFDDAASSEAGAVIVHELVHALQAEHLALAANTQLERSIDQENAFTALVEGDATLAMLGANVMLGGHELEDFTTRRGLLRSIVAETSRPFGEALLRAPAIIRVPLLARYGDGLVFAGTMHGIGGFSAVNGAHRFMPESTEQILHPAKYQAHERPDVVSIPALPGFAREGFEVGAENTLGELELSVYFGAGAPRGESDRDPFSADGWGGDRVRVYTRGDDAAAVWFTSWDDESQAVEAEHAARRVAVVQGGGNLREPTPHLPRGERVVRRARAVLITRGVPSALDAEVDAAFERFADGLPTHTLTRRHP